MSVAVDADVTLTENVVVPLADDENAIPAMEGNLDGLNDASIAPKQTQEVDPLTLLKQQANTTIDNTRHQVDSVLEEKPSDATAIETSLIDEDIQPIELIAESKMNGMNGQASVIKPVEGITEVVEANAEVPQIAAETTNGDPIAPASDQAVLESDPGRSSPGDQNHVKALPTEEAEDAKEDIKEGEAHSVVENSAESQEAVKESSGEQSSSFPDDVKVADNEEKLVEAASADAAPLHESGEAVTEEPAAVAATVPQGSESSTGENSPSGPTPANSMTDTIPSSQGEETVPGSAESEGQPQSASAEVTEESSVAAVEEPSSTEAKSEQLKEEIAISEQPGESEDGKPEVVDEAVKENVELQTEAIVPSKKESGGSQQNVEDILVEETRVDVEKLTVEDVENNAVNIEATPKTAPDVAIAGESTVTSVDNQTDRLIGEENQHPSTAADEHVRSEVAEVTAQPEEKLAEEPGAPVEEVPAGAEPVIHETDGTAGHSDQAAAENELEESVPVVEPRDPSLEPKHEDAAPESITGENSPAMEILESQAEAPVEEPIEPATVETVTDSVPSKPVADTAQEESPVVVIATEDPAVETSDVSLAAQDTASAPKDVQEDDTKPEDDVSVSRNEVDTPVETSAKVLLQPEESMVAIDPVTNEAASVLQPTHDDELQDHAAAQPVAEKGDEIPPAKVSDQAGDVSSPQVKVAEVEVNAGSVPAETNIEDLVSTTEQSASEPALTTAEASPAVDTDASGAPQQPPSAEVMAEAPIVVHVEEVPKEDVLEGVTVALEPAKSVESVTHEEFAPAADLAAEVQEPPVESSETPIQIEHVVAAHEVSPAPESHATPALELESQVAEDVAPEQAHEDTLTEKLPATEIANSEEKVEAAEVYSQVKPEPEVIAEPAAAEESTQQPEVVQDAAPEIAKVHDAVEEEKVEAPAADENFGAEAPVQDIANEPSETISITPVPVEEASVEPVVPGSEAAAVEEKVDEHAVVELEPAHEEAAQPTEDTLEPALEAAPAFEEPEVAVEEESVAPATSLVEEQRLHSEVEVVQKVPLNAEAVAEETVEETATVPEASEPAAKDAQQDAPSVEAVVDTTVETAVVEQLVGESIPAERPMQNQLTEESAPSVAAVEQGPETEDAPEEPHVKDVKVEEEQVAQDSDVPVDIERTQDITEVAAEPAVPEVSQESVPVEGASQSQLTTDQIPVSEPSAPMTIQEDDLAKGENVQEEEVEAVQSTQDTSEITSTEEIVKEAPQIIAQIAETPAMPGDTVKEPETAAAERADAIETTSIVTQAEQPVEASEPVDAVDETEAAEVEQAEDIPPSNDVASDKLSAQSELNPEVGSDEIQEPKTVPQTMLVAEEAENQDANEAAQEIVEPLTEDTKPIAAEQLLFEASDVEPKASEVIPVGPEASFATDKISLSTSVEGDAAMEAAEDLAEDVDQKLNANEEISSSFEEETAIPVSTDLAAIDVASPTVDVAGDTVQTTEQIKDDGLNADVTAHIERPKSPWTPSFQVTTVGGGATLPEGPEKPEGHVLVEPAEDAPASAADIVNASQTPQPAEDLSAEPAQPATPQLVLDTSSLEPEVPEATRPWTPSYSVHSQGSPRLEVSEVTAVDASEEPEEPPRPWTPAYSVHSQGSPQHVSQDPVQQDVTVEDESEGLVQGSTPVEVQEEVHDKGRAGIIEQHAAVEGASSVSEISTAVEEVKPVEEAPAVEEVEPVDEALVVEQVGHVGEAPIVKEVESTAGALAVDAGISEFAPESENQSQEAQVVDPRAHETADGNVLDDVNATQDIPQLVVATSNEASMEAGVSDPMKDDTDRPKSPSWVPSYSVSVQGSPLQETAKLGEEPSADVENVIKLADAAPVTTGVLSFVRSNAHLDEPQVTSDVAKAPGPTQTVPAVDEVFDKPQKETASNSDAKGKTTEIPPIVTDSVSLETPQNTERPKSPWTPSYSVTVQGAGQIADEELDTLEPLPQRAVPLPDGPALAKKDDIPNELGARLAFSYSTETFVTAIEVPDEMKTSIASLNPADKTEDDATRSLASKEHNQEVFPSVEDAVDGQKLSKLNISQLVSVSEAERSDITSATTEANSSSPSTRKRLESTTSSRFFPGGWTSTAAKTVGEGRTSLEIAQGEFISGKAPSTISTGDVPDVPEGSGGSTANESSDDSDDESEESVHETKRRWCIVM